MTSLHTSSRLALLAAVSVTLAVGTTRTQAQVFTSGDLVVSAYGTPTSTGLIDGQAVPISLQVFSLPTANTATFESSTILSGIVGEYGSSSEGNIQLSGNDEYLTITGYNATQAEAGIGANSNGDDGNGTFAIGTSWSTSTIALAQSSPADVARLADVIDANGNVVSSTSFASIYNANNARSAYSPDGSTIYISGQGDKHQSNNQGIYYSATGASYNTTTTPTAIYNAEDTRYVTGYNGNIYYSLDKSGSPTGIFEFNGSPTSAATAIQITAANNGLTGSAKVNYSPEGFWFANATTLYVADTGVPKAGGNADGGIQKWTLSGSQWTLQYTMTDSNFVSSTLSSGAANGETGFEAITGKVVGNTVDLYAVSYTAGDDNPNGLYEISDTLSATSLNGQTFTELASAPGSGGENFKGVSFAPNADAVPEPSTWALLLAGLAFLILGGKRLRKA